MRRPIFLSLASLLLGAAICQSEEPKPAEPVEFDPAHAEKMQEGLEPVQVAGAAGADRQLRRLPRRRARSSRASIWRRARACCAAARTGRRWSPANRPTATSCGSSATRKSPSCPTGPTSCRPSRSPRSPAGSTSAHRTTSRWSTTRAIPMPGSTTVVPDKAREFWSFRPLAQSAAAGGEERSLGPQSDRPLRAGEAGREGTDAQRAGRAPRARFAGPISISSACRRRPRRSRGSSPTPTRGLRRSCSTSCSTSPHYGERWARHWLDAARFAESHGFEQDYDRPYAYHFRDFVIEALNQDMPYDQFVRWQLAGDEFEPENPLALKATGFLGAGVFPTQITANEVERTRYDALDDMAATTGSAMLGLSIGCARCHDHKFDPIPQADYYRFACDVHDDGPQQPRCQSGPGGATRAAKAAFDEEHQPLRRMLARSSSASNCRRGWPIGNNRRRSRGEEQPVADRLDVGEAKSNGGATLTRQDDGSLLASGTNPDFDTFTFKSPRPSVQEHHGHAARGAGRSVAAQRRPRPGGERQLRADRLQGAGRSRQGGDASKPLKLAQSAGDVRADAARPAGRRTRSTTTRNRGWAVDPQFGKDHAAVFELAEPLANEGGPTLIFSSTSRTTSSTPSAGCGFRSRPRPSRCRSKSAAWRSRIGRCGARRRRPTSGRPSRRAALLAWYRHSRRRVAKAQRGRAEHAKQEPQPKLVKMMVCSEGVTPIRHHTQGADFFTETYFLKRGDCDQKMGEATQGFLQVLMTAPERREALAGRAAGRLARPATAARRWPTGSPTPSTAPATCWPA